MKNGHSFECPSLLKRFIYSFGPSSNPINPAKPATPPETKNAIDVDIAPLASTIAPLKIKKQAIATRETKNRWIFFIDCPF